MGTLSLAQGRVRVREHPSQEARQGSLSLEAHSWESVFVEQGWSVRERPCQGDRLGSPCQEAQRSGNPNQCWERRTLRQQP